MNLKAKKQLLYFGLILLVFLFNSNLRAQPLTFTITNPSGNYSITCTNTIINLIATSNYTTSPVSYTWSNQQIGSVTANSLAVTNSGIFSVTATAGSLVTTQTLAINVNTTVPQVSVTANASIITCATPTVQMLATSNTPSVSYFWPMIPWNVLTNTCTAFFAHTYTVYATDLNNGCTKTATILISEDKSYPNINSTGIFTVACPVGTVILSPSIIGATTNLTYSWTSPSTAITSGSNTASLTTNYPGTYTVFATNVINGCTTNAVITVYACVGILEQKETNNIQLFPNPAKSQIFLNSSNFNIRQLSITNTLGQLLFQEDKELWIEEIDVSSFPKGIYYLRVTSESGQSTLKFIKE